MARKILLADDSVTAQNMGRKILADAGYEVITVNNGSAALKRISEQRPDLIVLDVYMPGYSGLEVCQRLKETQETSRIPIILTVGKLEPFKPEESKRVRADGFIVKPFEASELLSALTKLEDKIVPRPETSKPGRFARAAALEEGRYDKTTAPEEDGGWKNRIAFPSKKKKAAEDEEDRANDDAPKQKMEAPAESKSASGWQEPRTEDTRVDLAALASEGLPKDVTPEEIAALAAAAAQMKSKIGESSTPEAVVESRDSEATVAESNVEAAPSAAASLVEQKTEESPAATEKPSEAPEVAPEVTPPAPTGVIAALTGLESASGSSSGNGSGNESGAQSTEQADAEPVTMALAAAASQSGVSAARWTAVSVAIEPEEAAISLEQEMQKAYAAYAAAESGHASSSALSAEASTIEKAATVSAAVEEVSQPVVAIPATPVPESAQSFSAAASITTEAVSAAVKELEKVAASLVREEPVAPAELKPVSEEKGESKAELATEQQFAPSVEKNAVEISGTPPSKQQPDLSSTQADSSITPATDLVAKEPEPSPTNVPEPTSAPQEAAMSVAAGAEKAPAATPEATEQSGDIDSIVESVLADMRPKIVAEISKKLGKKK